MSNEEDQKALIDRVRQATGLSLDRLSELLGLKLATLKKIYYRDVNLTDRNRAALQKLVRQYAEGSPIFGALQAAPTSRITSEPDMAYGARGKLRQAREAKGLNHASLAKLTGLTAAYLRDLEEGRVSLKESSAEKLSKALGLDKADLMGGSESAVMIDETGLSGPYGAIPMIDLPGRKAQYVPRLSYTQAGAMHEWSDDLYSYEGPLVMDLSKNQRAFALTVRGDSMVPEIREGDEAIVLWGEEPNNGDIVVACTTSNEILCKLYSAQERGQRIILSSYNPAHPPIEFAREELRWIYPVFSTYRRRR